jgi:hypothetical protein
MSSRVHVTRTVEDPVIRLIHPAICPIGGGTTLRLTGNHFCNQSAVRIGGKDASIVHFSDLAQGTTVLSSLRILIGARAYAAPTNHASCVQVNHSRSSWRCDRQSWTR